MADSREDRIRARAHQIWLDEGQPSGNEQRHWEQAAADVDAEDAKAKKPAAKKATAAKKPAAAKSPLREEKDRRGRSNCQDLQRRQAREERRDLKVFGLKSRKA